MKKLIGLLENLSGKKIVLEDSVFKSRKMDERLIPIKKELEKSMIIDESNKTIVIKKDLCDYNDCLVLEKFYQGYTINVNGSVNLSDQHLKKLPLINFNKINDCFDCSYNKLISFKNCPKVVGGDFYCSDNQLISLEHCPKVVGGNFYCSRNQLTSLEYSPKVVGGNFYCSRNQLTSLEHCPKVVGGYFYCYDNSKKFTKEDVLKYCKVDGKIKFK